MIAKAGHYEPVAREGYVFILPPFFIAFAAWWSDYTWTSLFFLLVAAAVAMFFRNPERVSPQGADILLSPADGRVMQVQENARSENLPEGNFNRISIFMSVFNVHVNRMPLTATVRKIQHVPGGFLDARNPEASISNEHNSLVCDAGGHSIEVIQIAGMIARRIACWVREGDEVRQGERFGLIRFGSRVDVYFPQDFSFSVEVGARVTAGVTVIARKADEKRL
jgi:phosphatidylserine decarboxylase